MAEKNISFFIRQNIFSNVRRLLKQLPAALKNAQLYPLDHPQFLYSLQLVQDTLETIFKYRQEVAFNLVENELYFGDTPLVEDSINQRQFISDLEHYKIRSLTFTKGVETEELMKFLQILAKEIKLSTAAAGLNRQLLDQKISHILLRDVVLAKDISEGRANKEYAWPSSEEIRNKNLGIFLDGINVVKNIMQDLENNRQFTVEQLKTVVSDIIGRVLGQDEHLLGLTMVKNYEDYTYNHSVNVAILSLYLGKLLGLSNEQLSILGEAALLHDVGKLKISKKILNKPGILTSSEWAIMERHTIEGAEILSRIDGLNNICVNVAFEHHLHYDLSGYPRVSYIKETNPYSRLVSVCDVFDAATSLRVYHGPVLPTKMMTFILNKKGSFFDPGLAKAFVQMMGIYPVGCLVRLDSGELAIVIANNLKDILRPRVMLVEQQVEPKREITEIDLAERDKKNHSFKRSVVEVLSPQAYNIDVARYFTNASRGAGYNDGAVQK